MDGQVVRREEVVLSPDLPQLALAGPNCPAIAEG